MAESLSHDETCNVESNVIPFGIFPSYFEEASVSISSKPRVSGLIRIYSKVLNWFLLGMMIRGVLVLWYKDPWFHWAMGYNYNTHQYVHWLINFYLLAIYSIYYTSEWACRRDVMNTEWVEVFQLLDGSKLPQELGTNIKVTEALARFTKEKMANCRYLIAVRSVVASALFASIYLDNDALDGRRGMEDYDFLAVGWGVIQTFLVFLLSGTMYLIVTMFDILAEYYKLRFHKINQDIETIISARESASTSVKVVELMKQILVEHDYLCWKLDHYNRYWSLLVMINLFLQPAIFVYCMYEICFMWQTWVDLAILWALAIESGYLFTRMFLSGVALSDEVHHVYLRAVRASFGKFPLDLRLQIRIFIQRISGPVIGFYCYDLFGLSRHNFYHALVHLGQNFFLVIDFVVSQKQASQQIAESRAAAAAAAAAAASAAVTALP